MPTILVANVGSTSFKYKLYADDHVLAHGRIERIGDGASPQEHQIGTHRVQSSDALASYVDAIRVTVGHLTHPRTGVLPHLRCLDAIGFKTVHIRGEAGTLELTESVLGQMAEYNDLAPAHNPPYIQAVRVFRSLYPAIPLIGSFEAAFHTTLPDYAYIYSVPYAWYERYGIRKYGFHGASHRYVSERVIELTGRRKLKLVSCHLGGSASLCAVKDGQSVDTTMGFSPQSGVINTTRNGTIDPFIIPYLMDQENLSTAQISDILANESGLFGISGVSGDMRDLRQAAAGGNDRARLAIDAFCYGARKEIASMAAAMDGVDIIAFAGGIGERSTDIRAQICQGLGFLGVQLSETRNTQGPDERLISTDQATVGTYVIPTNEEVIVARAVTEYLASTQ
jgi:acetate kinase